MRFLFVFTIAALSTSAWAQFEPNDSFVFHGQSQDLESIICRDRNTQQKFIENDLTVCQEAIRAAQNIAEAIATFDAGYLGCVEATYQGIREGFDSTRAPTETQQQRARLKYQSEIPPSALLRASDKAKNETDTQAVQDVIQNYRNALATRDHGININKTPKELISNWSGFADGYEKDFAIQNLSNAMNLGWVSSNHSWDLKLAAGTFYQFHALAGYSPTQLCSSSSTKSTITLWHYYSNHSNTDIYKLKSGNQVLQLFLTHADTPGRGFYDNIPNLTKTIIVQLPTPQPAPPKGPNQNQGRIVQQPKIQRQQVPISPEEAQAYREMFKLVMTNAYDQQYKLEKFSAVYLKAGNEKYEPAKSIGKKIGLEYARKFVEAQAYNERYREVSSHQYLLKLNEFYAQKFMETVRKFETSAILEMSDLSIIGETDDGVYLAGERLSFHYRFKNLGEKNTMMITTVKPSTYIESIGTDYFEIPFLSSFEHTTEDPIARISKTTPVGQNLLVTVSISGGGEFSKEIPALATSQSKPIVVNTVAKIERINPTLDLFSNKIHKSRLELQVNVSNASTQTLDTPIKIKAIMDGFDPIEVETLLSETNGGLKSVQLVSDNLDTKDLIQKEMVSGTVETYVGDQKTDSRNFSIRLKKDKRTNVVSYFSRMARESSLSMGSVNQSMDEIMKQRDLTENRGIALRKLIEQYLIEDIQSGTTWKKPYEVDKSVVRLLQLEYTASKGSDGLYMPAFQALGETLAANVTKINGSKNRKKFLVEIKKFAPSIKDRAKDYE